MNNKIVELIRLEENDIYGTFGVLKINKEVFCVTLEPSDNENIPFVSSIPCQQYTCSRIVSPKFGNTFQVLNVPERDKVLIHAGNVVQNTEGCIILAQHYGKLKGDRAVLNSGNTFKQFNEEIMLNVSQFHLTIREVY